MARRTISSGSKFEEMAGYSRAVVDGDWIFVSGTVGFDAATGAIPEDPVAQAETALRTIAGALAEADAPLEGVVRVRVYVSDRAYVEPVAAVPGRTFGHIRPTNTTIICQLFLESMKVEIEVTALRRRD